MSAEQASAKVSVSVVVPVYSGERYLEKLTQRIEAVRNEWAANDWPIVLSELVFVEDCAKDGSHDLIDQLAGTYPWVVSLHLARNSGQHAATMAGILYTIGDWVVTLDEDLQHPPDRIIELLRCAINTRADIMYAQAQGNVHGLFRDFVSRGSKHLISWLSNNENVKRFNSFRLIRGSVARAAASVCSYDTYFDVALLWFTERMGTVEMALNDERVQTGKKSGYSLKHLLSHARKLLLTSQVKALRAGAGLGLFVVAASGLFGLYVLIEKLLNPSAFPAPQGWTSLMLLVTFLGGMALLMLGLLLEYMSVLVLRAHGRPLYFVVDRSSDTMLRDLFAREHPRALN